MKNLKRILSVVLVVAMAFSLVTVAGAADVDYTDAAQIEHKAAVNTLTALGVLKGRDDGSFGAKDILSRAEMSTMITRVMMGKTITDGQFDERVLSLYASTVKFSDAEKGAWYLCYVGYVAANKVVTGDTEDGRGTFRPNDKVTYAEATKMILVALGYDPTYSGLVGLNWVENTLAIAQPLGILDDVDMYDFNQQLNRDDMSQMLYNMLEVEVLNYRGAAIGYVPTGETAIEHFFNQESQVVVKGVVVANGYTNLGNADETSRSVAPTDQRDSTYTIDTDTYVKYQNINRLSAIAKEFLNHTGSGESTTYTAAINYNPKTETVVYLPEAECYGQGTCTVKHNVNNTNCPKNNTDIFVVIKTASGVAEIGRTVDVAFVGGSWIENYSYAYITPTDDNVVETVAPAVAPTAAPTINSLTNDVKVAKGTIVANIWADADAGAAIGKFSVDPAVAKGITNAQSIITAINNVKTSSKEVVTLIDNDKDGEAEYVIKVSKDFAVAGTTAPDTTVPATVSYNAASNTAGTTAGMLATDGAQRTYTLPAGTEMAKDTKLLAYTALNGEVIYNVLEAQAGKVTHVSNDSKRIYFDDADEFNYNSGIHSRVYSDGDVRTNVSAAKVALIGTSYTYYLDDAGNIVWIAPAAGESVYALVYGVTSTNDGTVTGMTSTVAAKINTINVDGETKEYDIPKSAVDAFASELKNDGVIETDYTTARYCKITLMGDVVKSVEVVDTPDKNYLLGDLAIGTVSATDTVAANKGVQKSGVTALHSYVGDETVVFNFVAGVNAPVATLGSVTIDHGATGVKDVVNEGKLIVSAYDSADADNFADVMVTTLSRDGNLVNITNADTTDDAIYAIVRKVDVQDAKSNQHILADGITVKYTWDVPCTGDVSSITLGSDSDSVNDIKLGENKLLDDIFAGDEYIILKVGPKDNGKTFGAPVDTIVDNNKVSVIAYESMNVVSTAASRIAVTAAGTVTTLGYADDSIVLLWNGVSFEEITLADALAKVDGIIYTGVKAHVIETATADTFANTVDVAIVTMVAAG